jgi:hypothetical protein
LKPAHFSDNSSPFSRLGEIWAILAFSSSILLVKPVEAGIKICSGGNGADFALALFAG